MAGWASYENFLEATMADIDCVPGNPDLVSRSFIHKFSNWRNSSVTKCAAGVHAQTAPFRFGSGIIENQKTQSGFNCFGDTWNAPANFGTRRATGK